MQLLFRYEHENQPGDINSWISDLLGCRDEVKAYTVFEAYPADHFVIDYNEPETYCRLEIPWADFVRKIERATGSEFIGRTY